MTYGLLSILLRTFFFQGWIERYQIRGPQYVSALIGWEIRCSGAQSLEEVYLRLSLWSVQVNCQWTLFSFTRVDIIFISKGDLDTRIWKGNPPSSFSCKSFHHALTQNYFEIPPCSLAWNGIAPQKKEAFCSNDCREGIDKGT